MASLVTASKETLSDIEAIDKYLEGELDRAKIKAKSAVDAHMVMGYLARVGLMESLKERLKKEKEAFTVVMNDLDLTPFLPA